MKTRTDQLFDNLEAYLGPAIADAIDERNANSPDLYLENVKEWDRGWRDVVSGAREFPAVIFLEKSRSMADSFTAQYDLEIAFACKGSDAELIERQGEAYKDVLEDVLLADCHLGDTCLDSNNLSIETGYAGSVYIAVCSISLTVDRGGFL